MVILVNFSFFKKKLNIKNIWIVEPLVLVVGLNYKLFYVVST
jgi:hypothetical protein